MATYIKIHASKDSTVQSYSTKNIGREVHKYILSYNAIFVTVSQSHKCLKLTWIRNIVTTPRSSFPKSASCTLGSTYPSHKSLKSWGKKRFDSGEPALIRV